MEAKAIVKFPLWEELASGARLDDLASAEPRIVTENGETRVQGAMNQTLQVYSITGKLVASLRIDSPDKVVNLNLPRGLYIFKVGSVSRKVQI